MAELAKTHISITDESAFSDGIDTLIPLYVFATAQDKVLDESTGEIAIGTTKALAGQLSVITSRKDVTEKFGTPFFEEINGTIQQNSELNEVGLYGLFDAMGSTSLAYALRADIDLDQLQPKEEEPRGFVKNGTKWLDLEKSVFGLFKRNSNNTKIKSKQWDKQEYKIIFDGDCTGCEFGDIVLNIKRESNTFEFCLVTENNTLDSINLIVAPSTSYPTEDYDSSVEKYWFRTTPINGGTELVMKQYNSSIGRWISYTIPVCENNYEALIQMGEDFSTSSLVFIYDSTNKTFVLKQASELVSSQTLSVTTEKIDALGFEDGDSIIVKSITKGDIYSLVHNMDGKVDIKTVIDNMNSTLKHHNLTLSFEKEKNIKLDGKKVSGISLEIIQKLREEEVSKLDGKSIIKEIITETVPFNNSNINMTYSLTEPSELPNEGTLWFNDDMKVDIMVNDGMGKWVGFKNADESKNSKIFVTSEEPTDLTDYSLWIDTNNPNYPTIYRCLDNEWVLLDNTDQTTPDGVLFADARYYAGVHKDENNVSSILPTYSMNEYGYIEESNLLTSNYVDPDCPNPLAYPGGMILFNTRFSTNNVKEFKKDPFVGLYDKDTKQYTVGNSVFDMTPNKERWTSASGNSENGAGLFGKQAQRKMVVNALASAIVSNEDIRSMDYDFFFATCPGYPELDNELLNLNTDKKEMFYIVSDTPKTLEPNGKKIQEWASNANNAISHGLEGRVLMNEYMTRQYPSMGLTSNVDGSEVAVPTSIVKMKNLLVLPRGQICAGTQYGQVTNVGSVGYITEENEYSPIVLPDGLGEVCCANNINPIMPRRGTGLLIWGERTENSIDSSLSDEHAIITLLRLKRRLEQAVQPFFFRINNESLRVEFNNVLQSVLNDFVGTGELYDYALETGDSVNTPERINRRELWANIAIEVSKGVEQIYLPIRVVATGSL